MRNVWLGLVVAGAAACSTPASTFEHRSELEFATRGVALAAGGEDGVVGMMDTTCQVDVSDARIGSDYNFPTSDEVVHDNSLIGTTPAVIVISDIGAHVTYPGRTWDWTADDYGRPGIVAGRIWSEGVLLLGDDGAGGCELSWFVNEGADVSSLSVPGAACGGGGLAIDRLTGHVYVGTGEGILSADPSGTSDLPVEADLVVYDAAADVLYAALAGDSMLYGLEVDGTQRWATDMGGAITSFDAMGSLAQAVVMVSLDTGLGSLMTVDGFTGAITSNLTTPEAALHVETDDEGKSLALALAREVHFFSVEGL